MTGEPTANAARQRAYRSRIAARNERRLKTLWRIERLAREAGAGTGREPARGQFAVDQIERVLWEWRRAEEGERECP